MSLCMRSVLLVLACLACLSNGRRTQHSVTQLQSRSLEEREPSFQIDASPIPESLAEKKQAVKLSSAFVSSGPGAHHSAGKPKFANSHPPAVNGPSHLGQTLAPSDHSNRLPGESFHMGNPSFTSLHAVPLTVADDSGRHSSATHMHESKSVESNLKGSPRNTRHSKYGSLKFGFGVLTSLAGGVGIAMLFALIYRRVVAIGRPGTVRDTTDEPQPTATGPTTFARVGDISMSAAGSSVVIAKPDTHRREYGYVKLSNKLQAVVGSDPACDKAGAALCVNAGLANERQDLPGLAHFLEHMLFTGTKKYPDEAEYSEYISQNGGSSNAYTGCYETNYMFEIAPDKLEPALDRFSRFFYEPLLTRDCTEREINAVDSEFQMGVTSPWWRYVGIMNMSSNKDHPWHVHCGNNNVLLNGPKERGIDLYEEMLKFYEDFYSANGMTLCVIGRESVEELTAMVTEQFSAVANKDLMLPRGDAISKEEPFVREDWNKLVLQDPAMDIKSVEFSWIIPYQGPLWNKKPFGYIAHLLGHEGKGSMTALLKERGLITGCSCGGGAWLEGAFSLMNVQFDLTDKGVNAVEEIGTVLFTYLGMLQKVPVQKSLFEELKALRQAQFKFGNDQSPFDLASSISASLQTHPPSDVLAGLTCFYEYDPDGIEELLEVMTLDRVRVTHCAKSLADRCTDKETTYESPVAFLELEPSWLAAWKAAEQSDSSEESTAAASAIGLSLPVPNPFIPEDLSVKESPPAEQLLPTRLSDAALPIVYHRQDDVFLQPKADVVFMIRSPFITKDVQSYVKTDLWCSSVMEALNEFAYDAQVAGLSYVLSMSSGALMLRMAGFGDKLPELLQAVTSKMRSMTSVPANIYQIVADGFSDSIQNEAFHSQPISQCSQRYFELIVKGIGYSADEQFDAFKGLTRESLDGVGDSILDSCHVEAMILGNTTPEDADKLAKELSTGLQLKGGLSSVPNRADAVLPPGSTVWRTDSMDVEDPNHAVRLCIQVERGIEADAKLMVLSKILSPKFFDVLRTQQQLGYIVGMGHAPGTCFSYIVAQIQSEFPPDYVRSRIDAFFDEQFKWIEDTVEEEVFETCRAGVLTELKTKPKNLSEELGMYMQYFTSRTFDYEYRQRLIEEIEKTLTLESLRQYLKDVILQAPRLYIQVKKVVDKPDKDLPEGASIPEDPEDLRCWTGRQETIEEFKPTAEFLSYPTSVE